ncbi:MAG: DNA-binding protein [Rhodoglobus sp.]
MIVITADQINSRASADEAGPAITLINKKWGDELVLAAERTAGDEIQLVTSTAAVALAIALELTRSEQWSVGLGVGTVREPLGTHARESTGAAFIAARTAVDRAKKSPTHCAVAADPRHPLAADASALTDLLLIIRGRRSPEGWELYDLLQSGLSQRDAAATLGISPQSVSQRAQVAHLRAEASATVAIANVLDNLVAEVTHGEDAE